MELMLGDLIDLQKEKMGKCNSVEELSFKINQLNLDEEQEAEDIPIKRSIEDMGKYEGKSLEHSVCNGFKEICLSGIEDKSHFEFIECYTPDCDENPCSLISDRNLTSTMVDNEITNASQEVKNLCEQNQVLKEQLDKSEKRNQEESEKATQTIINLALQVEEATRIKEAISNSLKDKLEKSATKF